MQGLCLHERDLRKEWGLGKFECEFLRGVDGLWPVSQGAPAADDIDGGLFGDLVGWKLLEHTLHDESCLAVAFHLEIGDCEAEAQGRVEVLDFLEIFRLALHFVYQTRVEDFLVGVVCGANCGEPCSQFLQAQRLVLEQALARPDALQTDDGFSELSVLEPAIAKLKREGLKGDELGNVLHSGEFLVHHRHGGVVVAELQQRVELVNDRTTTYFRAE